MVDFDTVVETKPVVASSKVVVDSVVDPWEVEQPQHLVVVVLVASLSLTMKLTNPRREKIERRKNGRR